MCRHILIELLYGAAALVKLAILLLAGCSVLPRGNWQLASTNIGKQWRGMVV
jgi:hypothetical protein